LVPLWGVQIDGAAVAKTKTHMLEAASATSLALTGPGAYSIDTRLFGRREIVIRPAATDE
jgi:uncharacterized membrane protein YphA (DoxX/SURF4 family)